MDCRPPSSASGTLASVLTAPYLAISGESATFAATLPPCGFGASASTQTVDDIRFNVSQPTEVTLTYEFHATTTFPGINPPHADYFLSTGSPGDQRIVTPAGPTDQVSLYLDGPTDASGVLHVTLLPGFFRLQANGWCPHPTTSQAGGDWTAHNSVRVQLVACYANCDGSTTSPVVNTGDFTCFLQQYSAAAVLPSAGQQVTYANCDGSTTFPQVNTGDFTCFLQKYAAGCS
jgi:hypothetical protein